MACRNRRSLTFALVAACALTVAGAGGAASAERVDVSAKVSYIKRGFEYKQLRLRITRNGRTWQSGRLGMTFFHAPKVVVRDLDRDCELEVVVDTYTGGAHCCLHSRVFRYLPTREAYAGTFHDWGNGGYRLKNIDGQGPLELVSNDDRFAYAFTAFAASAFPVQLWRFDHGRLLDVTRDFPAQIERDATALWKLYEQVRDDRRGPQDVRGVLAAWYADQCLLGRAADASARLETIRKRGELGPRPDFAGWPQGSAYVRELRTFLRKLGYLA
jgi:hypothetical protein